MTLITNIAEAIKANKTDDELNIIIQDFITEWSLLQTVEEWRSMNYSELRRWAYPDSTILNDAMVKINSGDESLAEEGRMQAEQYYQDCLQVKQRFLKQ